MQKQRKLKSEAVSMTYGGPRGTFGQFDDSNIGQVSGATTYGGEGKGYFWTGMPAVIGGLAEIDPDNLLPGSNMSAVLANTQFNSDTLATKAGMDDATPTGASVGGTAAY
jgi:hypothetical protein